MLKSIIFFFLCANIGFFCFMTYQTKKEKGEQEPLHIKIITSSALSFILTLVFMFFIFIVFVPGFLAKFIFNLDINLKKLLFISGTVVGYAIVIDHLIFYTIKYIIGKRDILIVAILSIIRLSIFFLIGSFYSLTDNINFILSFLFVVLFALIDFINLKQEEKQNEK